MLAIGMLYLIEILHQTTTVCCQPFCAKSLYLIEILHQTTTPTASHLSSGGCILSKFYIKPQLTGRTLNGFDVVSYRNSTSNHNRVLVATCGAGVVSYRNSTSNHNSRRGKLARPRVVSYRNSTSNHNGFESQDYLKMLYLIEILHQTTTPQSAPSCCTRCILSKFYIKPQLLADRAVQAQGCILSKFYIKPQRRASY